MTPINRGGTSSAASFVLELTARDEPELLRAAYGVLAPALQVLGAADRPMLTVAVDLDRRRPRVMVRCWTDRFDAQPWNPPSQSAELKRAHRALGMAGRDLARQLARRWPANAVPRTMGVITDGIGVAASGDHPSVLTPEWMHDHIAGRARICVILPLGQWARWALESPPATEVIQ